MPERENTFVMALGHRYHAAWMAFYMPSHPRVYRWEPTAFPQSQYEIWPGPEERIGQDAMILVPGADESMVLLPDFAKCFERVEPLGTITIPLGDETRQFGVFRGVKLKTWKAIRPS
jgi:hypothetical protein